MINEDFKIINGNSFEVLDTLEENSIDAIVTDPPYGLTTITKRFGGENKDGSFARLSKGFMGQQWDGSGIEKNVEFWAKVYRVLKPGAFLLAFGGTRTYHKIASAIEDAGFEIRDCIMRLYGSGFPKNMNIGPTLAKKGEEEASKWNGWGTQLKPAYEPIIVARKPVDETVLNNVLKYGVGGINIEECKGGEDRYPANIILTYDENDLEEFNAVCEGMNLGGGKNASRYFYCAKTSKKDRDEGLEEFDEDRRTDGCIRSNLETARKYGANSAFGKNTHPTVKPTALMQYLVRLVAPKGATILDIFNGSGSTGKAVAYENKERNAHYKYIGIELDPKFCEISEARIKYVLESKDDKQISLFDFDFGEEESNEE